MLLKMYIKAETKVSNEPELRARQVSIYSTSYLKKATIQPPP